MTPRFFAATAVAAVFFVGTSVAEERPYGLGRPIKEAEITAWDIDVPPDGSGLPSGRGTVSEGRELYTSRCATCHGPLAASSEEASFWDEPPPSGFPELVGGIGSLATAVPIRTVGSYWPYATTLYDYIRRTMPFSAPQSLAGEEVYALVAYLLFENGIVAEDAEMDRETLPRVVMPNREGFTSPDPRPEVMP